MMTQKELEREAREAKRPPGSEAPVARRLRHAKARKVTCPMCGASPGNVCSEWRNGTRARLFEHHPERAALAQE
jgi:hypothetical protein